MSPHGDVGWRIRLQEQDTTDGSGVLVRPSRAHRIDVSIRRRWPLIQFIADALAWSLAIPLTTFLRYEGRTGSVNEAGVLVAVVAAVVLQGLMGVGLGLYQRRFHYGSFEEVRVLAFSVGIVSAISLVLQAAVGGSLVPRSVPALGGFVALVLCAVVRYVARLIEDRHLRPSEDESEPILVFGAGDAGRQIVRTMLRSPESPYRPVAFLDDDPHKARLRLHGLRVEGTGSDAVEVAGDHRATSVLVAVAQITGEDLRAFAEPLLDAGIRVLVLPPLGDLLGTIRPSDIRPLSIADLLGRHPADIDVAAIAGYVRGRRVLVTGAGGSIGSELCRQLRAFEPAALLMLDRDESGLHATQLMMEGRALLDSPSLVLADIRDRERVFQVFQQHRPEVVFHAAALKHMPLLEFNPSEAWKTNVVGTQNVLEAAEANDVIRFVNISTDKAADPTTVLGFSKRLCERLTAEVARSTGLPYVSVRFGNVLGSKGSMLGVFERQVAAGGPVTVTHPEVTRYFMTIEEAVALTIQAGAIGGPGEVLVLDMGEPVRVEHVARRLIEQVDDEIEIVYTGLRPGEKLHEVLLGTGEPDYRPMHHLISHVKTPPIRFAEARAACAVDGRLTLSTANLEVAAAVGAGNGAQSETSDSRSTRRDDVT